MQSCSTSATVTMQDNSFTPGDLKVAVGETVTFTNEGAIAHTATATDGADFDSGSVASGESFEFTAEKAGTVSYVCTFHPGSVYKGGTWQVAHRAFPANNA